jgi:phosphatidylinositol alpha-mannosyltransferase
LRIALVTEFYHPHLGGVTEHVQHLAQEFRRLGHTAWVVTSHMDGEDADEPFVHRVGTSRVILSNGSFARITTGFGIGRELQRFFRAERIDVVHVHGACSPTLGFIAPTAARRVGLPIVGTWHSWFRRSIALGIMKGPIQDRLDEIAVKIAVSQPVVDAMSRYLTADWEVIPNGVSVGVFHPNGRRPIDALSKHPRLLFLGRLDPRNGLEIVLDAMPGILAAYPTAELTVVGDGPLRGWYERRAQPLGDRVRFVGRVYAERPEYYGTADLYLCPTNKASFGITLLESMACGTPMIVSDITGFRELVDQGAEAVLVPPDRPAAWATAAIDLIGDPERREAMGLAGLAKAQHYSWDVVGARVLDAYRRAGAR